MRAAEVNGYVLSAPGLPRARGPPTPHVCGRAAPATTPYPDLRTASDACISQGWTTFGAPKPCQKHPVLYLDSSMSAMTVCTPGGVGLRSTPVGCATVAPHTLTRRHLSFTHSVAAPKVISLCRMSVLSADALMLGACGLPLVTPISLHAHRCHGRSSGLRPAWWLAAPEGCVCLLQQVAESAPFPWICTGTLASWHTSTRGR